MNDELPPLPEMPSELVTENVRTAAFLSAYAATYGAIVREHFRAQIDRLELETDYLRAKVTWIKALLEEERAKARERSTRA